MSKLSDLKKELRALRAKHCPPTGKMKKADVEKEIKRLSTVEQVTEYIAPEKKPRVKKAKKETREMEVQTEPMESEEDKREAMAKRMADLRARRKIAGALKKNVEQKKEKKETAEKESMAEKMARLRAMKKVGSALKKNVEQKKEKAKKEEAAKKITAAVKKVAESKKAKRLAEEAEIPPLESADAPIRPENKRRKLKVLKPESEEEEASKRKPRKGGEVIAKVNKIEEKVESVTKKKQKDHKASTVKTDKTETGKETGKNMNPVVEYYENVKKGKHVLMPQTLIKKYAEEIGDTSVTRKWLITARKDKMRLLKEDKDYVKYNQSFEALEKDLEKDYVDWKRRRDSDKELIEAKEKAKQLEGNKTLDGKIIIVSLKGANIKYYKLNIKDNGLYDLELPNGKKTVKNIKIVGPLKSEILPKDIKLYNGYYPDGLMYSDDIRIPDSEKSTYFSYYAYVKDFEKKEKKEEEKEDKTKPERSVIMKLFNVGKFGDIDLTADEKNEMVNSIKKEMKSFYEENPKPKTDEVHEIIRELIKSWIEENK